MNGALPVWQALAAVVTSSFGKKKQVLQIQGSWVRAPAQPHNVHVETDHEIISAAILHCRWF